MGWNNVFLEEARGSLIRIFIFGNPSVLLFEEVLYGKGVRMSDFKYCESFRV